MITQIYADDMMRYIAYIEICVGLGLGLGPVFGSALGFLGYSNEMYAFGAMNMVAILLCIVFIPNALNISVSDEELEEFELEEDLNTPKDVITKREKKKITWFTLLSCKEVVFALIACFMGTFNIVFWDAWLFTDLSKIGFNQANSGYVIGSQSFVYLFCCLLLPYTCEHSPRRFQFMFALFGFGFTMLLMGPSAMFKFPDYVGIVIASFPFSGFF